MLPVAPIVYFDCDDIDASVACVRELKASEREDKQRCSLRTQRATASASGRSTQRRLTGVAVLLTVLGGLVGLLQVAVMGRFGGRMGVIEALTFSTAVQLLLSATILVVARTGFGGLGGALRTPAWMWLGGLMGLIVVGTITFAQPRIGATATIGILIAGQLVMGALIDRYGLFGVERIDISLPRAIGIVLLGIGAGLSLVR
jgi:transporter family-2 protein